MLSDEHGRAVALRGSGRSGGEGTVYDVSPGVVAKIYHRHRLTAEHEAKLRAMLAAPPRDPAWDARRHRSIAWPTGLLFEDGAFVGFLMPAIARPFVEAHAVWDPADRIARLGGAFTWRHLVTAGANVASSVAALHANGHRVGDLRETNVLVAPNALIAMIDCDSFQIGAAFFPRVGTADYLPPELHGVDFARDVDRTHADAFALAVMVFRFLMGGVHPFAATGRLVESAPTTEAKIARGHYPYRRRPGVAPPAFAPPYEAVPPEVRALFKRAFVTGLRRPGARPTPAEWFETLKSESARARACRTNPNHAFGAHLRRCPWCAMADDPFPAPGAVPGRARGAVVTRAAAPSAPPASSAPPSMAGASVGLVRALGVRRTVRVARAIGPRALARAALRMRGGSRGPQITRARVVGVLALALVPAVLLSPLGHSAEAPRSRSIPWRAAATGPCPEVVSNAASCRAEWRFTGARLTEQHVRRFVVVSSERARLEVSFSLRVPMDVPWIDHRAFNAALPEVCLGPCPERVEVRDAEGVRGALIDATGVAARGGTVRAGERHRGTWVFDVSELGTRIRLHYPGLDPIRLLL